MTEIPDVEYIDTLPAFGDARLRTLFDYWKGLCVGGQPPVRPQIDPSHLVRLLSIVWILERETDGRYLCRLVGEDLRRVVGRKAIGEYLDEMAAEPGNSILKYQYDLVLDGPSVVYSNGHIYRKGLDRIGTGERLVLPLRDKDGNLTMLLGVTTYQTTGTRMKDAYPAGGDPVRRYVAPLSALI